ncbi:MAG: hypothetical protein KKE02_16060 [Alphaproteobacteria bacterium]|nr:hypothetical protein [Alphaproteobacteria bacterium]MBU1514274.1 hypothetical protein [Alphaproteobacteria bacterium]MBU2097062.1 hypothetical protein [Alphaproteobacteria bacterium]MBU2152536.1 hypothetical protein [Alphaproteobacteria bacterium]MBU2308473.1 hypothetical protein [Alphaproteobacteria bacterium]
MKQKHVHKPYRSLTALNKTASTTRVLNLASVMHSHGATPEHAASPFFKSPLLNRGLVLKHRLRADDPELLGGQRGTATKVIIPFDPRNLGAGGASFLVGEKGWLDLVEEISDTEENFHRDRSMLECLSELPSFDPFLLREHLRRKNFRPADCYFTISASDREQMRRFVQVEIGKLIQLAYAGQAVSEGSTVKLVEMLLASDMDDRLEPLRLTLRLEGEAYREGIFSWKGFLYYKWALSDLMISLRQVITEIGKLELADSTSHELNAFVHSSRSRLQVTIQRRCRDVAQTLQVYDEAFAKLTQAGDAVAFRDFLLSAPAMFLELGERVGMISHIASFWRYRFPPGASFRAKSDDVLDLLQDFETGLAQPTMYLAA